MVGLFECITILSCKLRNSGVHGELMMGYCSPGNYSGIVRVNGFLKGC